jgi:DNA-binding MarR family transcriptional regulator
MEISIWQLTELGTRAARNPHNPDEPAYRIIAFLDQMGTGTTAQIAEYRGLDYGDVSVTLHRLARLGLAREITRESVQQQYQMA